MNIDLTNLLLMACFALGNAALIIAVLNRLHALPLPHKFLHTLRHTHDLLIIAFPCLLVWFAGIRGPGLLHGGEWRQLPIWVLAYLQVCGVICGVLPFIAAYRWLVKPPTAQIHVRSETIDIEQRLGFRPVGIGPYASVTSFPGNEFLKLEVSEKQFRLPGVPQAWNGLSVLQITDLHFTGTIDRPYFEQVVELAQQMQPDIIAFTGDLLDNANLIDWIPSTLGRLKARLGCYFVLGNHDLYLGITRPTRQRLEEFGWQDVAGDCVTIEHAGKTLAICGSELPWMGKQPDLSGVADDAFRLLLSHTPDNFPWARRHKIDLMLAGHNHGGQVRLPLFGPVYSPSLFGCRYASGVFWQEPTLLYVSRGIAGKHPLRLNCLPELTKLVLRPQLADSKAAADLATKSLAAPMTA